MKDKFNNAVGPQARAEKTQPGLIVPILAVLFLIAGLQAATQFFAYQFGYQSVLGSNYSHVYWPWRILEWWRWYERFPDALMRAASSGIMVTGVGMLVLVLAR
jgi:type IV secretion system protein VirD4